MHKQKAIMPLHVLEFRIPIFNFNLHVKIMVNTDFLIYLHVV